MNPNDNAIQKKMEGMSGNWNGTSISKCRIGVSTDYEKLYKN